MRTPPEHLDPAQLAALLANAWGFPVADLVYAPVGFGSHHWIATDAGGERQFVTVDELGEQGLGDATSGLVKLTRAMRTAHALRDAAELPFVVAPIPSTDATLLRVVDTTYAVAVFPFIDGAAYPDGELATDRDRDAVVEVLAALHARTKPAQEHAGVDDLEVAGRADLERALGQLSGSWDAGPYAEPTRQLLATSEAQILALLEECDRLADVTRASTVPWVITHGEPKSDNFLATDDGPMLVDWDTVLVAPAARDVWMLEGDASPAHYSELTGRAVTQAELAFYRLRWDLTDVAAYVRWFTEAHEQTADAEIGWAALTQLL